MADRIAEIRARHAATTPGHWHVSKYAVYSLDESLKEPRVIVPDTDADGPTWDDKIFIVEAHNADIPHLLAAHDALTARVKWLEGELGGKYLDAVDQVTNEENLRLTARVEALEAAIKVMREALRCSCGEPASYHAARKWLDDRDIYNDDLNDLWVILAVAYAALEGR